MNMHYFLKEFFKRCRCIKIMVFEYKRKNVHTALVNQINSLFKLYNYYSRIIRKKRVIFYQSLARRTTAIQDVNTQLGKYTRLHHTLARKMTQVKKRRYTGIPYTYVHRPGKISFYLPQRSRRILQVPTHIIS